MAGQYPSASPVLACLVWVPSPHSSALASTLCAHLQSSPGALSQAHPSPVSCLAAVSEGRASGCTVLAACPEPTGPLHAQASLSVATYLTTAPPPPPWDSGFHRGSVSLELVTL